MRKRLGMKVMCQCSMTGRAISFAGAQYLSGPPSWALLSHHDDSWMMLGT